MTFAAAVKTCFSKYVSFSGRAARAEYWYFFLFLLLLSLVAAALDWAFFTSVTSISSETASATVARSSQPVQSIVALATFLPHLAAAWRRMHDTGRSGWLVLLPTLLAAGAFAVLVFGIGAASHFHGGTMDRLLTGATLLILLPTLIVLLISPLVVLFWLSRPSQPETNKYGPNPYEVKP
ncbi:DUF805 domain-containing protein [Microbulbifer sp. S227A]|uniref:DUF805 domain-containing protein n=1 Tax=Microbulbifer sp. S227A TaxID=3415131 RepID=UPI003C7E5CAF